MKLLISHAYFIDCLSGNHSQTAQDLYRYYIEKAFEGRSEYIKVNSKDELINTLKDIEQKTKDSDIFPLLHIESHGLDSGKGLSITDTEIMYWKELRPYLEEINISTCNNLTLCLSSCNSVYIIEELVQSFYDALDSKVPFSCIIGTDSVIDVDDLFAGYVEFYKSFQVQKNIPCTVTKMNKVVAKKFRTDTCKSVFLTCMNKFADTWIKERTARILENPSLLTELYSAMFLFTYDRLPTIDDLDRIFSDKQLYIDYANKKMKEFLLIHDCEMNKGRFGVVTDIVNFERSIPKYRSVRRS